MFLLLWGYECLSEISVGMFRFLLMGGFLVVIGYMVVEWGIRMMMLLMILFMLMLLRLIGILNWILFMWM